MIDAKKVGLNQIGGTESAGGLTKLPKDIGQGPSFQSTLDSLGGVAKTPNAPNVSMNAALGSTNAAQGVKFSNHAVERMMARGIKFNQDDMGRLNSAVEKAAAKGSKDSLVLMNDSALIVSVKNKTVVTVMDKTALKENVFTNIDSTIVM